MFYLFNSVNEYIVEKRSYSWVQFELNINIVKNIYTVRVKDVIKVTSCIILTYILHLINIKIS